LKLEFSAELSWQGKELRTMKASKFAEAQKAFIPKQGEEGTPVAGICRKAGIGQSNALRGRRSMAACCLTRCGG
jgi:hypothetical protein